MADNVQITEGSGTAVHADEFTDSTYGLGKSQQVKIADGTAGSSNKLKVNSNGAANVTLMDTAGAEVDPVPQSVFTARTVTKTLTVQAAAYAAGDVMVVPEVLAAVAPANDVSCVLQSLTFIDEADQGPAMDVYFFSSSSASLGTINAAVSISDDDARTLFGPIEIVAGDWKDMGGVRVCTIRNIGLGLLPVSTTDDVYIGIVSQGAPTFAATNDLTVRATFL